MNGSENGSSNDTLINPANTLLVGTKLPYFPRGGPLPKDDGLGSNWGGMSAGPNMIYPTQAVDGRVHAEGGVEFSKTVKKHGPCSVGSAILTDAMGNLSQGYQFIIHTPPPFSSVPTSTDDLMRCYLSSFAIAASHTDIQTCVTPILGAGACGFPLERAAIILRQSIDRFLDIGAGSIDCLRIAVQSPWEVDQVLNEFETPFAQR